MTSYAEWYAFLKHNFLGHFVGYCLIWPFSPAKANALHDRTIPKDAP